VYDAGAAMPGTADNSQQGLEGSLLFPTNAVVSPPRTPLLTATTSIVNKPTSTPVLLSAKGVRSVELHTAQHTAPGQIQLGRGCGVLKV
jgi:hypothetical protein